MLKRRGKIDSFVEWKKGIAYLEADGPKVASLIRKEKDGA